MKFQFNLFIILMLGVASCSSPQKLYEKGKYFKSFDAVLGDLNGGKKDRKAVLLLNKSFSKMIDVAKSEMYILNDGYNVNDLSYNFKQYEEVDKRYIKGRSFLDDENDNKYGDFTTDKKRLVSDTYEEGKALMLFFEKSKNKSDARNAYYHFELVNDNGYGFKEINELMYDARLAATLTYNIKADLDSDFSYQWDVDRKFDDLEGEVGFIKIVYDNTSYKGDCNVELDFSRLDINERSDQSSQEYSKEIIDGYTTKTDTSGNTIQIPNYKKVSGRVIIKTVTKTVSWRVDLEIVKSTISCDLREDRFRETIENKVRLYDISGDSRAIPDEYKNPTNERIEDTDDMVDELLDKLYRKIRNYFY